MKIQEAMDRLEAIARGQAYSISANFWRHTGQSRTLYFKLHVHANKTIIASTKNTDLGEAVVTIEQMVDRHYNPQDATEVNAAGNMIDDAAQAMLKPPATPCMGAPECDKSMPDLTETNF
jgi:hypothetical protein